MPSTYTFSDQAIAQLIEDHRRLSHIVQGLRHEVQLIRQRGQAFPLYIGKTSGTMTARSGDTLGTGVVDVYRPAADDIGTVIMSVPGVLNIAGEIAGDTIVGIQSGGWGKWYCTVEGCI